ncbi:MAG: glycine cleavage system protein H [Chloroflexi bacterium]|nr:glycine cleavage system protein H [Chloroflexota bacterium]
MAQVDEFYLPDDLYYDRREHIWARIEDSDRVRVGLDQFGQKAAGTVAYVKIMPVGKAIAKGRAFGSLEAGKYIGPLKAPVAGKIVEVNAAVLANPKLVNSDPYGEAWFIIIEPSNLAQDLGSLAHGPDVQPWLENEVKEYRDKGLLKD